MLSVIMVLNPLHHATAGGHKEIAELLISEGADVNAKDDEYGSTPLHNAAANGHKEIAELLITKGADVNAKEEDGGTPLDMAIKLKNSKPPTSSANTAARRRRNWKLKGNETHTNHNNRSRASGGVFKIRGASFAQQPLVVSGGTGNIVQANPEKVAQDDPLLRAAHFTFVVDPSLEAHVMDEFEGNVPDKFFWQAGKTYRIDGKKYELKYSIDGREHVLNAGGQRFELVDGNYFRFPHSLRSNFVCGSTARYRHHRRLGIRKSSVAGQCCVRCSSVARADSKSFANCHSGSKSESTF